MQLLKIQVQDLEKLITQVRLSRRVAYINIAVDGPSLRFSFENDEGRLVTVTVFDETLKTAPTLNESRSL